MTEYAGTLGSTVLPRRLWSGSSNLSRALAFLCSLICGLMIWSALAWWVGKPAFLPSPGATLRGAIELIENGQLAESVLASFTRVVIGFSIGTCIGIPLGLFMGKSQFSCLRRPLCRIFPVYSADRLCHTCRYLVRPRRNYQNHFDRLYDGVHGRDRHHDRRPRHRSRQTLRRALSGSLKARFSFTSPFPPSFPISSLE